MYVLDEMGRKFTSLVKENAAQYCECRKVALSSATWWGGASFDVFGTAACFHLK